MASVASLVQELSEIQDRLVALPDDAFAERSELIRRRDELRSEAEAHAAGADPARPTEDLLAELAALRRRRSDLSTAGSGAVSDEAIRLESRIARIEVILESRHVGHG
jgi:hypothetical protein